MPFFNNNDPSTQTLTQDLPCGASHRCASLPRTNQPDAPIGAQVVNLPAHLQHVSSALHGTPDGSSRIDRPQRSREDPHDALAFR
jgi:hypothetical protein